MPSDAKPHGTEIPGRPARLTLIVKMSLRYIESGSDAFSPTLNAVVGDVGASIASTLSNA